MRPDLISHEFPIRGAHMRYSRDRLPIPGTDRYASPVLYEMDHFTDADTTNLTAHTPDVGGAWAAWLGAFTVVSNAATSQSTGSARYVKNTCISDGLIVCRFKCGAANGNYAPGIIFRGTDANHWFEVYIGGDGTITLYKYSSGFTSLGTHAWTNDANWHTVRVTMAGTSVTIQIDSDAPWTVTGLANTVYMGCYHGIAGWKYSTASDQLDDFQIFGDVIPPFPGQYQRANWAEDFGGADTTRLNTRGWTEENGTWTCQSAKGQQALTASPVTGYLATRDVGMTDVALEMKVTTPAASGFVTGFNFRTQDLNHFIELELNNNTAYNGWSGFGCWYYVTASTSFVPIMQRYFTPASNTTYTLRLRTRGSLIIAECVEAGLQMIGSSTQFATGTKVGLFEARNINNPNVNTYDNFIVRIP